jgi:hypothetical protein
MLPSLRRGPAAVIANGQSLSAAIDLKEGELMALSMPASWTAANLTLQSSKDGGETWQNVHDKSGTEVTITAAADRYIVFDASLVELLRGVRNLKIRSGTSGAAVNQGAERTIVTMVR